MGVKIPFLSDIEVTASKPVPYCDHWVCHPDPIHSVELRDPSAPAIIGILDTFGFEAARSLIPELQSYADYCDWLDVREGAQIGLAMTGVDARIMPVVFQLFLSWCEAACLRPSEAALDAYARTVVRSQVKS